MASPGQMWKPCPVQVALVDALTEDYPSTATLARRVWPRRRVAGAAVRFVIWQLRRRRIKVGSLKGFGYRLEEE